MKIVRFFLVLLVGVGAGALVTLLLCSEREYELVTDRDREYQLVTDRNDVEKNIGRRVELRGSVEKRKHHSTVLGVKVNTHSRSVENSDFVAARGVLVRYVVEEKMEEDDPFMIAGELAPGVHYDLVDPYTSRRAEVHVCQGD